MRVALAVLIFVGLFTSLIIVSAPWFVSDIGFCASFC